MPYQPELPEEMVTGEAATWPTIPLSSSATSESVRHPARRKPLMMKASVWLEWVSPLNAASVSWAMVSTSSGRSVRTEMVMQFSSLMLSRWTSTILQYGQPIIQIVGGGQWEALVRWWWRQSPSWAVISCCLIRCGERWFARSAKRGFSASIRWSPS
jgi:hypothetical protein